MPETETLPIEEGRSITVARKLPAATFYALPRAVLTPLGRLPFAETFEPLTRLVVSWEGFPGAPGDVAAWGELDAITELMPIWTALQTYVGRLLAENAERRKN